MRVAKAFCPGHITGFFEICRTNDLMSTGSRGAGLCLSLGATSRVTVTESPRLELKVDINGKRSEATVTKEAIRRVVGGGHFKIEVSTVLDLPVSQGFGMSAAGALSASLALSSILRRPRRTAFEAAHAAEIIQGGGLGDISAIMRGGITVRQRPGLPPAGKVIRIKGRPQLVLCVMGRPMLTKSVLRDPKKSKAINASGSRRVDQLVADPSLKHLMELSAGFAIESGLASRRILDAINAASKLGAASMSMLGNSVFAVGDPEGQERVLSDFGKTYSCQVDTRGAKVLQNARVIHG